MDNRDTSFVASDDESMAIFDERFFAERFQWLYEHVPDPKTGEMYSDYTLVPRLFAISGGKVDLVPSSMHNYRTGKTIPRWTYVVAIAKAFGRTPRFFTEPNFDEVIRRSEEEERLVQAMKRSGVRNMMLRAADLPDDSIASLTSIVEQVGDIIRQHREATPPKPSKHKEE